MPNFVDETGKKYGRLFVIDRAANHRGMGAFNCVCECGNYVVVLGNLLRSSVTRSCGCLRNGGAA